MFTDTMKNRSLLFIMPILLILALLFGQAYLSDRPQAPQPPVISETNKEIASIETGIAQIDKFGNVALTISPDSMKELGYEAGDIISVKIAGYEADMPLGTAFSDVDSFNPVCLFINDHDNGLTVKLSINSGSMAETAGIAVRHEIDEDPGYAWNFSDESVSVFISMKEKAGYLEEYLARSLGITISTDREDYPGLDDRQFANFRAVNAGNIGTDVLFRSSSPIDPYLNRSKLADEAALESQIHTVLNVAENEIEMKGHPGFLSTYYSQCDIIAINLSMDLTSDKFKEDLAQGYRFFVNHSGPYLIHCSEGKDRTGYVTAILECLMGVSAQEIVDDYMQTFVYLYRVEPYSDRYRMISSTNIEAALARLFNIDSIFQESVDLGECAESFLLEIGMTEEEIGTLKENLSQDYGGLS